MTTSSGRSIGVSRRVTALTRLKMAVLGSDADREREHRDHVNAGRRASDRRRPERRVRGRRPVVAQRFLGELQRLPLHVEERVACLVAHAATPLPALGQGSLP